MRFLLYLSAATACFAQAVPQTLTSIAITPDTPTVVVGSCTSLALTGSYSDRGLSVITALAEWSSAVPAVATVTGGQVCGLAQGPATITASVAGLTQTVVVTVTPAPIPRPQISAISAWYLLGGQSQSDPKIAATPQYKWTFLDPTITAYFAADGQPHLTASTTVSGAPVMATARCVFAGGDSCQVTHNLKSATPMIGQVIVNSGCGSCYQMSTFTENSFTVTSTLAADLTFVIQYAPPAVLAPMVSKVP